MEKITDLKELRKYLNKIDLIFTINTLLEQKIDNSSVVEYYSDSDSGYRLFHSTEGSVHMALNFNGVFNKDGYYEQAKIVSKYIDSLNAKQVLELGSGKGFNSSFLAKNYPDVNFMGVDITPTHVKQSIEKGKNLSNLAFKIGNYQDLDFDDETIDVIFEVESICHASDMKLALSESFRVLKPGGMIIMFDGFRKQELDHLEEDVVLACRLVEASMAIERPWIITKLLKIVQEVGFNEIKVEDISQAIMPNLAKFQLLARGYFKYPNISRAILKFVPENLVKNSIAGLLMPFTISAGAQGYYIIVLQKPKHQ